MPPDFSEPSHGRVFCRFHLRPTHVAPRSTPSPSPSLQPPLTPPLHRPGRGRPEASHSWWGPGLLRMQRGNRELLMPACTCARVEFTAERAAFVWLVPRRECGVLGDLSFEADLLWRPVRQTLEATALRSLSGSRSDRGPEVRRGPGPQVGLSAPLPHAGCAPRHFDHSRLTPRPLGPWLPGACL